MPVCTSKSSASQPQTLPRELLFDIVNWIPLDKLVKAEQKAARSGTNRQTSLDMYRNERFNKLASELQYLVGQMDQEKLIQESCNESWFGSSRYLGKGAMMPIFIKLDDMALGGWKLILFGKLAFGCQQSDIVCKCADALWADKLIEFITASVSTDLMLDDIELRWPKPMKWPQALKNGQNSGVQMVGAFARGNQKCTYYELANKHTGDKFMVRIGGGCNCQVEVNFQEMVIYRNSEPYPMFK